MVAYSRDAAMTASLEAVGHEEGVVRSTAVHR
jgi:hypothetical protein